MALCELLGLPAMIAQEAKMESGEKATTDRHERKRDIEHWLRAEVAPVYDAMLNDPARALPVRGVFDEVRSRHTERIKARF
jgi:hypothetical protein